ncbi:MAG: hypothetical protein ACREJG_07900 [Candidatus Rokuibacteriota bacterium]
MTALLAVGAVVMICIGGLVGASWTTQVMASVSRRHAAERRNLNDGWRALEEARQARGEPAFCARCHQKLSESSWLLVVSPAMTDEEDDGT